jgi:Holliday junction resolvasome RuvABC ATP-dependent DNA helicase subunit
LPLEYWSNEKVFQLIKVIENELSFTISNDIKKELVQSAKGSPRFIKKFFRSVCAINKSDDKTMRFVLNETQRELSDRLDE